MAVSRKWILVLAVTALLVGAASADAQTFQCTANAGVTPLVRAEGIAELVGDLLLNCSGTVPAGGITSNIRIFANTAVTSKLAGSSNTLPQASEALLMIDDPTAAAQVYRSASSIDNSASPNVFQGTTIATNAVDWYSIPIAAAGSAGMTVTRTIRITNIRTNAAQLGVSATLIPQPIQLSISISGATSVGVNNPTQTVAWVQKGMTFNATSISLKQCVDPGKSSYFYVIFTEGFASAFKARGTQSQTEPGVSYNTESGLTPAAAPQLGYANQGTRLGFAFTDIPDGVILVVPGSVSTSTGLTAETVTGIDATGGGGTVSGSSRYLTNTSGEIAAVYEVTSAGTNSIGSNEALWIRVSVVYDGQPDVTTGSGLKVRGSFAPVTTVTTASFTDPVPRFQDTSSDISGRLWITPCTTTLLFPYVTNASGFDTGIAISNTSEDSFESGMAMVPPAVPLLARVRNDLWVMSGSSPQSGTCRLNYYGNIPETGGAAPAAVTTPEVGAGEQLAFILSSGGSVVGTDKTCAQCATPGFHGYIIAVCNFQYAHGFAFVSDLGSAKLAEGYLALVIPENGTREAQAFSLGAAADDGEQIVF